jgi:hypothetical protein
MTSASMIASVLKLSVLVPTKLDSSPALHKKALSGLLNRHRARFAYDDLLALFTCFSQSHANYGVASTCLRRVKYPSS